MFPTALFQNTGALSEGDLDSAESLPLAPNGAADTSVSTDPFRVTLAELGGKELPQSGNLLPPDPVRDGVREALVPLTAPSPGNAPPATLVANLVRAGAGDFGLRPTTLQTPLGSAQSPPIGYRRGPALAATDGTQTPELNPRELQQPLPVTPGPAPIQPNAGTAATAERRSPASSDQATDSPSTSTRAAGASAAFVADHWVSRNRTPSTNPSVRVAAEDNTSVPPTPNTGSQGSASAPAAAIIRPAANIAGSISGSRDVPTSSAGERTTSGVTAHNIIRASHDPLKAVRTRTTDDATLDIARGRIEAARQGAAVLTRAGAGELGRPGATTSANGEAATAEGLSPSTASAPRATPNPIAASRQVDPLPDLPTPTPHSNAKPPSVAVRDDRPIVTTSGTTPSVALTADNAGIGSAARPVTDLQTAEPRTDATRALAVAQNARVDTATNIAIPAKTGIVGPRVTADIPRPTPLITSPVNAPATVPSSVGAAVTQSTTSEPREPTAADRTDRASTVRTGPAQPFETQRMALAAAERTVAQTEARNVTQTGAPAVAATISYRTLAEASQSGPRAPKPHTGLPGAETRGVEPATPAVRANTPSLYPATVPALSPSTVPPPRTDQSTDAVSLATLDELAPSAEAGRRSAGVDEAVSVAPALATDAPSARAPITTPSLARALPLTDTGSLPDAVATQVRWMDTQSLRRVDVRVTPQHLGPVSIEIAESNGSLQIQLNAGLAQTRELLEQALPRLREVLDATEVSVGRSDQESGARPGAGDDSQRSAQRHEKALFDGGADNTAEPEQAPDVARRTPDAGQVDMYA